MPLALYRVNVGTGKLTLWLSEANVHKVGENAVLANKMGDSIVIVMESKRVFLCSISIFRNVTGPEMKSDARGLTSGMPPKQIVI